MPSSKRLAGVKTRGITVRGFTLVARWVWALASRLGASDDCDAPITSADDKESVVYLNWNGPLRASIALMKRSRREILQSRRRKDTAALDRVEVQIRDTRAPSKLRGRRAKR